MAIVQLGVLGTGLLAGGALGAKHAAEPDHVAAVATLAAEDARAGLTGVAWGVGHAVPILFLGVIALSLDLQLPAGLLWLFELGVVGVLLAVGVMALRDREPLGLAVSRHAHHRHLSVGQRGWGLFHSDAAGDSLAIGVIHGLAGSGGVTVALATAAPSFAAGGAFLAGFALASIAAMAAAAWLWGRATTLARYGRRVAGVASIAIGLVLAGNLLGVTLPL